ncbi:hypothetical protein K435DRAFT_881388, partial [Dendrothele bispora CBS 962.96]
DGIDRGGFAVAEALQEEVDVIASSGEAEGRQGARAVSDTDNDIEDSEQEESGL